MELMTLLCFGMVLPAVGLVTIQHVLDGSFPALRLGERLYGLTDKVFVYLAVKHTRFFKSRIGHAALHGAVAVAGLLAVTHK